jgi:uncharacterized protein YciI
MAYFVMTCLDKPGALDLRLATREPHLAWLAGVEGVRVRLAGPFLDEAGEMIGSMFILEAADLDAVRAFSAADPYTLAGLFAQVEIRPWRRTVGIEL